MERPRCPGQDMRYWNADAITYVECPWCGAEIEFWKDEPVRACTGCGQEFRHPKLDLGCAKWCKYARECVGDAMPHADMPPSMCDRIIAEMKALFGADQRRIAHASRVLAYAERIQEAEGGDGLIVKAAAILHDIGIHEAERKHGSTAGRYQELEGPPIARAILEKLGVDEEAITAICRIVGSHHTRSAVDTKEFRVIWDADWMVNIADEYPDKSRDELESIIDQIFMTSAGKHLARRRYLGQESGKPTDDKGDDGASSS